MCWRVCRNFAAHVAVGDNQAVKSLHRVAGRWVAGGDGLLFVWKQCRSSPYGVNSVHQFTNFQVQPVTQKRGSNYPCKGGYPGAPGEIRPCP